MKFMLAKKITNLVPLFLKKYINNKIRENKRIAFDKRVRQIKQNIIEYFTNLPTDNREINTLVDYLKANEMDAFLYPFKKNYKPASIEVFTDESNSLKYVLHQGKRLYFKRTFTHEMIKNYYSGLLAEQDLQSPHLYLTNDFTIAPDSVIADIGVAEGNFGLSNVENAKHLYIFEADSTWMEALHATFEPWKDKVTINNVFISAKIKRGFTSVDQYFKNKIKPSFIKVDVDGAEQDLLNGAKELLESDASLKMALCTYHKADDAVQFDTLLKKYNFNTQFSEGYMLFYYDKNIAPPYFRKGVLRANR
jgi:hypothetical protein